MFVYSEIAKGNQNWLENWRASETEGKNVVFWLKREITVQVIGSLKILRAQENGIPLYKLNV